MSYSKKDTHNKQDMKDMIYFILCIATAMIGYQIHRSLFWSIFDFFFAPFVWAKWLIMQQVNMSIIKETFSFFLK
jgi:hypothetical protein